MRSGADLMLARSEASPQRFYSMSARIRVERAAYASMLQQTQAGGLFRACLGRAIADSRPRLGDVLFKADFWADHPSSPVTAVAWALVGRDHGLGGREHIRALALADVESAPAGTLGLLPSGRAQIPRRMVTGD